MNLLFYTSKPQQLAISEKKFTAGDCFSSVKTIWVWIKENLLFAHCSKIKQKWAKYDFSELLWIKIIAVCRLYGLSFESILLIKNKIIKQYNPDKPELAFYPLLEKIINRNQIDLFFCYEKTPHVFIVENQKLKKDEKIQDSFLKISINDIVKSFILNHEQHFNDDKHITSLIDFGLLTLPEAELYLQIKKHKTFQIKIMNTNTFETINKININQYLDLLQQNKYQKIQYEVNDATMTFRNIY